MRLGRAMTAAGIASLLSASAAAGDSYVHVGRYSRQKTPQRAEIGASVHAKRDNGARRPVSRTPGRSGLPARGGSPAPTYPTLRKDSPQLRDRTPAGPGTHWYDDGRGHRCLYIPDAVTPCYTVTDKPGAKRRRIDPAAIAAAAAARLPLVAGRIEVSPQRQGLTGLSSWFWLERAPAPQRLSVSAGGVTVTVTAVPRVEWQFGDRASDADQRTSIYRPDRAPDSAQAHGYETRCLPGDRGHDPYILDTCTAKGYQVQATVHWSISYQVSGARRAAGTLPARTSSASTTYPVSESRAFLTATGGPR